MTSSSSDNKIELIGIISEKLFSHNSLSRDCSRPYDSLLLVLVDSILQQGMNYENFVKPRIHRLQKNLFIHTQLRDVAIEEGVLMYILQTQNKRKIQSFYELLDLLNEKKIYSIGSMRKWIEKSYNKQQLLQIHGIGEKTVDYLLNLLGFETIPIDRHVFNFLACCGYRTTDYSEASSLFSQVSEKFGFQKSALDYEVWNYMRAIRI